MASPLDAGLRSLSRKMNVTIPKAAKRQVRYALAISANQIVDAMEAFAPELSGDLINSIGWVWGRDAPEGSISVGTVSTGDPDLVITIFAGDSEAYYARWQEFGTVNMAPNPYFFPAYRIKKRGTRTRITRALRDGIRQGAR